MTTAIEYAVFACMAAWVGYGLYRGIVTVRDALRRMAEDVRARR